MAVIDLGEVTGEERSPAVPLDHRRLLRAVLAVLSIAGLLVIAGRRPAATAGVRPLWTIDDFRDDDSVVLAGHDRVRLPARRTAVRRSPRTTWPAGSCGGPR